MLPLKILLHQYFTGVNQSLLHVFSAKNMIWMGATSKKDVNQAVENSPQKT